MQPKLEKILLNNNDTITTSCNLMTGMSSESFQLKTRYCGYAAYESNAYLGDFVSEKSDCGLTFNYYDENGIQKSYNMSQEERKTINTGLWMHYDVNGNWQLCGDTKHHNKD